ncbi:MAG: ribbon-helix-helix protein, CopG family [Nitrospirota bacterium]
MIKASKIAISLPTEDLARIETIRKKLGLQRSAVIHRAIRFWLKSLQDQAMVKKYEEGYKRLPESAGEMEAFQKMSAEAFKEEGLQ